MATITVKDGSGSNVAVELPLAPGRAAAAGSRPVALSTEDFAAIDGIEALLTTLAGAIASARMAVNPVSGQAGVAAGSGAAGATTQRTIAATDDPGVVALQIIDDWDETDRAKVNVIVGQAGVAGGTGTRGATTQRITIATDDELVGAATESIRTATASITRPADTNAYAAGDALSNSTSAPTAGGMTFTVARANNKGGVITDLLVVSSAASGTPLQGELWLYDTAPTAINDNAAFSVSDAQQATLVAIIPFALTTVGANSVAHVQGLNIGFNTVSATTLRGLVRVTNAYTPESGEVVTFRLKVDPEG